MATLFNDLMHVECGTFEAHQDMFLPKNLENHVNLPVFDPLGLPADHTMPHMHTHTHTLTCHGATIQIGQVSPCGKLNQRSKMAGDPSVTGALIRVT